MSVSLRFAAAGALIAVSAVSAPVFAQGDSQRAESLNAEGKELFRDENYEAALDRFERARDLEADPRFHFNVCFTLYMLGDLRPAADACDQVQPAGADDELLKKRDHVMGLIEEELAARPEPQPDPGGGTGEPPPGGGTGDPPPGGGTGETPPGGGTGDPPPGGGGATGGGETVGYEPGSGSRRPRRDPPRFDQQQEIPDNYNWSLGAQIGPLRNIGLGGDHYQDSSGHLRLFSDFILSPALRLGLQAYAGISRFETAAGAPSSVSPLSVVDLGGAFYQHIPLAGSLYFTPLGGAHLSIQQPDSSDLAFGTLGVRAEASLNYVFGADDQHEISVTPVALNLYLPASETSSGLSPETYGLDSGSATYTFGVGYSLRFAEPFAGSLITLE